MGRAFIQIQQHSGTWQTINECDVDDVTVKHRLDDAVRSYRTRARAVSKESGSVIDLRS